MNSILTFKLIIQDPGGGKSVFEISPGVTLIGRQPGVALLLDQQKISRHHAKIDCNGQECTLTDLTSANGTRLNGKKLQPVVPYRLDPGAVITIGDYTLVFEQVQVDMPAPIVRPDSAADLFVPAPEEAEPVSAPAARETAALGARPPDQPEEERPPEMAPPPPEPPPPPAGPASPLLSWSSGRSHFLVNYLPEAYRTDFMECFLGLFESIILPIEWNIDNFDLYLSPGTSPAFFLPWLENWFGLPQDATWSEAQRRTLLAEAHRLYAMRGTRWALSRMLEIYTGQKPVINDTGKDLQPDTFTVRLSGRQYKSSRKFIQKIIEENKPAQTTFVLEIVE